MTPEWIIEYAQDCRNLLGIGDDWQITVTMTDAPNNNKDNSGAAHVDAHYLNAIVEINTKHSEPSDKARHVIFHEMMHVALGSFRMVIDQLFLTTPEHMQTIGRVMISQAEEQYIQRTSRAILAVLKPEDS